MIYNMSMRPYMNLFSEKNFQISSTHTIWKKYYRELEYYSINNFNMIKLGTIVFEEKLSDLEWAGNEVNLCDSSRDFNDLLKEGFAIIIAWKKQMESLYRKTKFNLILSIDNGVEEVPPSVTLRFYAIRNEYYIIQPSEIQKFEQPTLILQANY